MVIKDIGPLELDTVAWVGGAAFVAVAGALVWCALFPPGEFKRRQPRQK